jgi:2-methylisocitrate lyase-like PEP mutase family enzyme
MPSAFDPISAKLIEGAAFVSVQCTGSGISASYLGRPDYSILSLYDMLAASSHIADVVDIPVLVDADNGFGNAINAY